MTDFSALDNPVWNALTSGHRAMALSNGLAARYPADVSPLAGMREPTAKAFADLCALVEPGEAIWVLTDGPLEAPADWTILRTRLIDQMVYDGPVPSSPGGHTELDGKDVAEMAALAAATEPGPFLAHTIRTGRYFGIRAATGPLAAMAGERMALGGFTEISAVCTDPAFRGHGYAKALVVSLTALIVSQGKVPFLHVKTENGAKLLYEKIGFRVRRPIQFSVITRK